MSFEGFAPEDLALQTTNDARCHCVECGIRATRAHPLFIAARGWLCTDCWAALCVSYS